MRNCSTVGLMYISVELVQKYRLVLRKVKRMALVAGQLLVARALFPCEF